MTKMNEKTCGGYSLVELMIAMVIAAIMFSGIYMVSIQSLNLLKAARNETRAMQAAQYEIEKLRSYSWTVLENMSATTTFDNNDNAILSLLPSSSGEIRRSLYSPHGILEPMYAVSVTVSWTDFAGDPASKTVTSILTRTGMIK
jgi:prepilin-type N-terminal cleavage/methylation domain-containing protein